MNQKVKIFDTTLRDGEQSPGNSMNLSEKIRFAFQLEKLGVNVIESGFPAASPDDFSAVKAIAEKVHNCEICGLARAHKNDIKIAADALKNAKKPRIHTFVATSETHLKFKLKKTKEEVLKMTEEAVKLAKSFFPRVDFSPEDAGRSDRNFLKKVIEVAIDCGADVINIPDTVGYLLPSEFGDLIKFLIQNCRNSKKVIFATHCHNDLGMAVANSLSGVSAGARQVECTINGIGERAGNAALEEIVMAIKTRPNFFKVKTDIKTKEIFKTSKLLSKITGNFVAHNKAIVGKNAFSHEAGIHQHGVLAHRETYEILKPEDIGLKESEIVLGKHSGRAALKNQLEKMGYKISDENLLEIFNKFKKLADKKKEIEIADLDALMLGEDRKKIFQLENLDVHTGTKKTPSAEIDILKNGKKFVSKSNGTGPVDAAFKAVEKITGKIGRLKEFRMDSVTAGLDAQAVVFLKLEIESGETFFGRAGNTDIVIASVLAYLDAIEKFLIRKKNS